MKDTSYLKFFAVLLLQIVLMLVVDHLVYSSFMSLHGQKLTINEFSNAFDSSLRTNQIFFIVSIALSFGLQFILLGLQKKNQQTNKVFLIVLVLILCLDSYKLYKVVVRTDYYQTEYLLSNHNQNINNLRIRTYLYHYFKIKGDAVGMKLVIDKSLMILNKDDMAYLVEHRKDKTFEKIIQH